MQRPPKPSPETLAKWNSNPTGVQGDLNSGVFCYEITEEPRLDPELEALPPRDLERILDVSQRFHEHDHASFIPELEAMIKEFPGIPKLRNHLALAYLSAGREDDYARVIRETYERFPDYLFGIVNMGQLALKEGRVDDVPAIFHHTMLLHELQGGRR